MLAADREKIEWASGASLADDGPQFEVLIGALARMVLALEGRVASLETSLRGRDR